MTTTPLPRRHWFQFRLRTLLVLMLLVSIGMGWVGVKMRQARRESEAVAAIMGVGGWVIFDYPDPESRTLRQVWGLNEYFAHPCFVLLDDKAGMEYLLALRQLHSLELVGTEFTNAELVHLNRFTRLQELSLTETTVNDTGLEHLVGLDNLRSLFLEGIRFSDAGLDHLTSLPELEKVNLIDTGVSDGGVRRLQQALPNCKVHRYSNYSVDGSVDGSENRVEANKQPVSDFRYRPTHDVGIATPDNCDSAAADCRWDGSSPMSRMNRIIPT